MIIGVIIILVCIFVPVISHPLILVAGLIFMGIGFYIASKAMENPHVSKNNLIATPPFILWLKSIKIFKFK